MAKVKKVFRVSKVPKVFNVFKVHKTIELCVLVRF